MDDVRAVLSGERRWAVVRGDAVVWMLRLAWEFGPFAHTTFCDPPYHLTGAKGGERGFMGTTWDGGDVAHRVETWRAALLCSLPGAHLLAASGTRTYHRLAVAAEDAGWEPREMVGWLCAQGMAKTGDVSKRIDKMHGATREVVGRGSSGTTAGMQGLGPSGIKGGSFDITAPATDDARQWEGWSESLAPSMEPMLLARKPFRGSTAANLLTHGCGALNIDAGRVGANETRRAVFSGAKGKAQGEHGVASGTVYGDSDKYLSEPRADGRWPKTIALVHNKGCCRVGTKKVKGHGGGEGEHPSPMWSGLTTTGKHYVDENGEEVVDAWECEPSCAVAELARQSGHLVSGKPSGLRNATTGFSSGITPGAQALTGYGDEGTAARFYYQAKAHASERWMLVTCGCGRRPMRRTAAKHLTERKDKMTFCTLCKQPAHVAQHATVKPLDLDRWLARLVCVPGGVTLVPFCGSGSEMIAALEAGSRVVGFELEQDHADIAVARLTAWDQGDRDDHDDPAAAVENLKPEGPRQRPLFGGRP